MKKIIFRGISLFVVAAILFTAVIICGGYATGIFGNDIYSIIKVIVTLAVLVIIVLLAAGYISDRITERIIKPIDKIDLGKIPNVDVCEELKPFFERIESEKVSKEETEKMRREFSANVSHELKTPLTSISGYAQMINNGMAKEEDFLTFTHRIEKEASRLILLINDIIKLSNLDEQDSVVENENIDLDIAAQETIAELEKAATDKNVRIFYSGEETYISGSRTLIGELMFNIIDNAIKYNRDNGTVTVFVGTVAQGAVFSVKDTGIGIPEEDVDRIFERFYRVDKSHSKTVGGTGLGLSIVKHIAICHNAKIDVKSRLGEGTTISVVFKDK
ncbi:MAG: sensor histidine kinase [Clostridia bacterium]